jgi:hypothetical protein
MKLNRPEARKKLNDFLDYLEKTNFYGTIEVDYGAGKPIGEVKAKQKHKVPNLPA